MKKQLALIFMLSLCAGAFSEEYNPILTEGKSWTVLRLYHVNQKENLTYTVSGDTVVDGRMRKRIIVDIPEKNYKYALAAYEEGEKLYSYGLSDDGKPVLLLDFSKKVGDCLNSDGDENWGKKVVSVDNITVNGVTRKRIIFEAKGGETPCWVEGIGSNYDCWIGSYTKPTDGSVYYMQECRENGKLVFSQLDFGVTMSVGNVLKDETRGKGSSTKYSVDGKRLSDNDCSHVYIQNGKKYVRR